MIQFRTIFIFITIFILVAPKFAESQQLPIDQKTNLFRYQEVVTIDSVSSDELYSRAKAWIATFYKSANDVIQLDDQNTGRLIVKGNFGIIYYMSNAWVNHTLTIEMKDGRYRYILTDFIFDNGQWSAPIEDKKKFFGQRKKLYNQVSKQAEASIAEMKEAMKKASPTADDNW